MGKHEYDDQYKIIIIGREMTGKSSILHYLKHKKCIFKKSMLILKEH